LEALIQEAKAIQSESQDRSARRIDFNFRAVALRIDGLTENTVRGHRTYLKQLKAFFGESKLDRITVEMIEEYRDQRRRQPTKISRRSPFEVSLWKAASYAISTRLSFWPKRHAPHGLHRIFGRDNVMETAENCASDDLAVCLS
jgi:hypothetical protein